MAKVLLTEQEQRFLKLFTQDISIISFLDKDGYPDKNGPFIPMEAKDRRKIVKRMASLLVKARTKGT